MTAVMEECDDYQQCSERDGNDDDDDDNDDDDDDDDNDDYDGGMRRRQQMEECNDWQQRIATATERWCRVL